MAAGARDGVVDAVRGLALLMIFVNHVPGNPLENFTSRNFGFSDATEIFVFLAGYSAATAYAARAERVGLAWTTLRAWGRAFRLYVLHLVTLLLAVAIVAAASIGSGDPHFQGWINLGPIFSDPARAWLGVVVLGHQAGYFNILPMYVVFMVVLPVMLALGRRGAGPLLAVSAAIYLWAQVSGANLPNYPNPGGWFFNPLAWQLMFVTGFWCGDRRRRGLPPAPYDPRIFWGATLLLLVALIMKAAEYYPSPGDLPLPFFLYGQEKTFMTVPRMTHALALLYVGGHLSIRRGLAEGGVGVRFLASVGRQGLAVFCLGSVLAVGAQAFLFIIDATVMVECAIVATGIILQVGLAWLLNSYADGISAVTSRPVPARWFSRPASN